MISKKVTVHVPAHDEEKEVWVAEDGTEFDNPNKCQHYEHTCKIEAHRVYKRRIVSDNAFANPDREENVTLYYLEDEADFQMLMSWIRPLSPKAWEDEFKHCGPGWYMHWYSDCGDELPGLDMLVNYAREEERLKLEMSKWIASMRMLMGPIEGGYQSGAGSV